ncbi:MAG TPA: ATP-binding protein [Lachnospiraceae bacterium]|nr:ATP-binding protein [Lachnospiraceae bacterium]HPF29985.1 ATP-binding protein [Lachnospiraceae bacterium]
MDQTELRVDRITLEEFNKLGERERLLLDLRDENTFHYGGIYGAMNIPEKECGEKHTLERIKEELNRKQRPLILYGKETQELMEGSEVLRAAGYQPRILEGGYDGWLRACLQEDRGDWDERREKLDKSIRKKYHKAIFSRFAKAINEYELLAPNDKVAVCISGGKDSMLMARLFMELQHHRKFPFELVFLMMDPGYNEMNRKVIEYNARLMEIPLTIFQTEIFDTVYEIEKSPCYLCARMRRGHLYSKAKELGCNKIALGHHYDDVIETVLMGMLYGGQVQTMMPKLHSTNFEGMELIRPMYLIREEDVRSWRDYNELHFIQCACRFTDSAISKKDDGSVSSKRMEIKNLIGELKKVNPYVESNIFKSVENVNLSTIIAYKEHGVTHHFLERYESVDKESQEGEKEHEKKRQRSKQLTGDRGNTENV